MKRTIKTIGVLGALAIPSSAILSCSDAIQPINPDDQDAVKSNIEEIKKLNTTANISGKQIFPSLIKDITHLEKNITQFHKPTEGVNITIEVESSNDVEGTLTVKYIVSKDTVTDSTAVHYTGFKAFILETAQVDTTIIPDVSNGFVEQINTSNYFIGTNNDGVYQVQVTINAGVAADNVITNAGQVTKIPMTDTGEPFIPDVNGGWIEKIDPTHYLIGTSSQGVYQIELDNTNKVTKSVQVPMELGNPNAIPNVENGWIERIGQNQSNLYYLVGTNSEGLFEVTVNLQTGEVSSSNHVDLIKDQVSSGWIQRTGPSAYLMGTNAKGVYQIEANASTGLVTKVAPYPTSTTVQPNTIPNVNGGWSQQLDGSHYLIGTNKDGVYQVETYISTDISDPNYGMIKSATPIPTVNEKNAIPDVGNGWILRNSANYYLVGTKNSGVYLIEIDPATRMVANANPIKTTGINSIPTVSNGWVAQTNSNILLIGTQSKGVYVTKVTF